MMQYASARVAMAATCLVFLMSAPAWSADIEYGKELFSEQCATCHTVIADITDKSGPNLNGVFGRKAGTVDYGLGHSEAMTESGIVWDAAMLDQFLKSPARMVRGNKMVFVGLVDAEDRSDLISFLQQLMQSGDDSKDSEP